MKNRIAIIILSIGLLSAAIGQYALHSRVTTLESEVRVNKYYLRDILSTLNGNITYEILREHPTSGAVIIRDVTGIPIYFDYPGKIEDDDFMMDHKGMAYGIGDSYEMDETNYYAPPIQPQPIGKLVIEFNPDGKEKNDEWKRIIKK